MVASRRSIGRSPVDGSDILLRSSPATATSAKTHHQRRNGHETSSSDSDEYSIVNLGLVAYNDIVVLGVNGRIIKRGHILAVGGQ
jgi:hypothetical protein